jgi:hypothetical protein
MEACKKIFTICICVVSNIAYAQYAPQYPPVPVFYNSNRPEKPTPKLLFSATFKNDSTITGLCIVNYKRKINTLQMAVNNGQQQIVRPPDTKSISRTTDKGTVLIGIPADTCWLFKVVVGKLHLYTDRAEENLHFAVAFQEGEGPLLPLTKKGLMPYMKHDEKLVNLLNRGRFVKAILKYNNAL